MKTFTTLAASSAALIAVASGSALVERTPPQEASCTDFTPYNYKGCYTDAGDPNPALIYRAVGLDSSNTTIEQCVAFCKGNDWRYAGLEFFGICFCGSSVTGQLVDDSKCDTPCHANKTESCGGNGFVSIYSDPTFPPIDTTTIADYAHLGCYSDLVNGRTLEWQQTDIDAENMDVNMCLSACRDDGYPFAGVEFGKECYCGVVLANGTQKIDSSKCDFGCAGDPSKTCGGAATLNLYYADDLESTEPCKDGQPEPSSSTTSSSLSTTVVASSSSISSSASITASSSVSITSSSSVISQSTSSHVPSTTSITITAHTSPSTTKPTTTTTKTTTTAAFCTSYTTTTPVPNCEYKCGKWCSKPLPQFGGKDECKVAVANCAIQLTSCFLKAGWPESLNCLKFKDWCSNVSSYCGNSCPGSKCSVSGCKSKYPPQSPGGQPAPVVSTSIFPCSATATTTKTTTKASTSTSAVPVPTANCVCEQPHNPSKGYTRDSPAGDIELPCLTCNNVFSDYKSGNQFKVYNDPDPSNCPSYSRNSLPAGCKKACDNQYTACVNVYAESCKGKSKRTGNSSGHSNGPKYTNAMNACKSQWKDCYAVNNNKNAGNRCTSWNNNWN